MIVECVTCKANSVVYNYYDYFKGLYYDMCGVVCKELLHPGGGLGGTCTLPTGSQVLLPQPQTRTDSAPRGPCSPVPALGARNCTDPTT